MLLAALDKTREMELAGNTRTIFQKGGDTLTFDKACIETPDAKQTLICDLSLSLKRGVDTGALIMGPNGVGKSSVFRVLADLWTIAQGSMCAPAPRHDMLFVPTTPYMALGTLADQVTYPMRLAFPLGEQEKARLNEVLKTVKIEYLAVREGLETRQESWEHRLSLGEQQRLGIARVYWHRPRFVCL